MEITQGSVSANGLDIAYLACGESGPLAVCLHGFPDTAHTWRHLLPRLADAGYRAVAPFLRGYAPTSVPADGEYGVGALAADALAFADALGGSDDDVLVGHDWGAFATYCVGAYAPERFRSYVTMAVPPTAATMSTFFTHAQLKRSFYVFLFQTPLAEAAVPMNDFALIEGLWADWSPGYDGAIDVSHVREALRDPARTAAAIGYYRAMLQPDRNGPTYAAQQAVAANTPPKPYLYLHGTRDGALAAPGKEEVVANLAAGSRVEIIDGVGHFLHLEQPKVVNDLVIEWLAQ
ncbi:MAG TPA: alpha/beta hydrolase [Mycobacteriales bacterium]|nr:alpha/beta hydrolase [Mycobacteriales bacterium]